MKYDLCRNRAKRSGGRRIDRRQLMHALGLRPSAAIATSLAPKVAAFAAVAARKQVGMAGGGMALKAVVLSTILIIKSRTMRRFATFT